MNSLDPATAAYIAAVLERNVRDKLWDVRNLHFDKPSKERAARAALTKARRAANAFAAAVRKEET